MVITVILNPIATMTAPFLNPMDTIAIMVINSKTASKAIINTLFS
jgi:hypothetical protein